MDRNVIHVRPEQTVELCMALMTEKRVRHLPVLEGNKMIGIVSIGDLLKGIISKQKFVIDDTPHVGALELAVIEKDGLTLLRFLVVALSTDGSPPKLIMLIRQTHRRSRCSTLSGV